MRSGPTNSIVDVAGIAVGHADLEGAGALSGTTVVLPDGGDGAVAGVDVRGAGPGTRETDALDPGTLVDIAHAVVLTGGSAYGLAAASGVADALGAAGHGFPIYSPREVVPIVPAAVVFDLKRGGDFAARPGAALGAAALAAASTDAPAQGVVGAGRGTLVGGLKGGIGSASVVLDDGTTVAAIVAANGSGSAVDPRTGELWGAPHLLPGDPEPPSLPAHRTALLERLRDAAAPPTLNTTIGVVATDATLTVPQCRKLAGVGHDGLARAVRPAHGMTDGDTLFGLATARRERPDLAALREILTAGADVVARAIVAAVLAAHTVTTPMATWTCYRDAVVHADRHAP